MNRSAVFKEKNSLPCPELHFSIDNRDGLACARQNHTNMRRAIVFALSDVLKIVGIFRDQTLEKFLEILSCRRVGVFHNDEAATRVLNEDRRRPATHAVLIDLVLDFAGDLVGPLASGANFELILVNAHERFGYTNNMKQIVAR